MATSNFEIEEISIITDFSTILINIYHPDWLLIIFDFIEIFISAKLSEFTKIKIIILHTNVFLSAKIFNHLSINLRGENVYTALY